MDPNHVTTLPTPPAGPVHSLEKATPFLLTAMWCLHHALADEPEDQRVRAFIAATGVASALHCLVFLLRKAMPPNALLGALGDSPFRWGSYAVTGLCWQPVMAAPFVLLAAGPYLLTQTDAGAAFVWVTTLLEANWAYSQFLYFSWFIRTLASMIPASVRDEIAKDKRAVRVKVRVHDGDDD
jgi:hypothetical protein